MEVVEAAPVVDDGTVSTALTEGDSLPWTEFFSEAYTGLINTMTSLDLTNLDFNYEKTLDRLQDSDGSVNRFWRGFSVLGNLTEKWVESKS